MTFRAPHCKAEAFTLIEVVMAMAVVSFALVAIAGLMPVGLQSMRDSQNDQAVGTIANQLRGDLQQISFVGTGVGTLGGLPATNYFYTVEGVKTTSSPTDPNSTGQPYYLASFAISNAYVNGSAYAGAAIAPVNAAVVKVTLAYPYNPSSPSPKTTCPQTNTFSLFATKQVGL